MSSLKPNRIAASQRARLVFDSGTKTMKQYTTCDNCQSDLPCKCEFPVPVCDLCGRVVYECRCDDMSYCEPDYSLWEMGEPVESSLPKSRWSDTENGDNDAYEIFY